jgi:hypothetical protein
MRDFNVGLELAPRMRSVELAIAPDAIREVAVLGGRIAFTAYRPLRTSHRPRTRRDGA